MINLRSSLSSQLNIWGLGMAEDSRALALAGIFMSISAALHVFAIVVTGLHFSAFLLLVIGLIYAVMAISYLGASDYWAHIGIFIMIAGIAGAYALKAIPVAVPGWWLTLIIWADVAVAFFLIVYYVRK